MAVSTVHHHHPWAFAIGLLGNIISIMVYLAPLPTFYRVYKKKSTEGFQSITYVVALFSAMLWIYYAFLKSDQDDDDAAFLLITINSIGCLIETIYIFMFITYAPKNARMLTAKLVVILNCGLFCLILLLTLLLAKGSNRVRIVGWVCVAFSTCVFAAPFSIMKLVIRTKSVEFMPFSLSFFLTLSAILWFSYGLLLKDLYVALPNVLGFIFGVLQMVLYVIYKDIKKVIIIDQEEEDKLPNYNDIDHQHSTTVDADEVEPIDLQVTIVLHDHHSNIMDGYDHRDHQKNNLHEQITDIHQTHHQKI